jgi:hypothetical protein
MMLISGFSFKEGNSNSMKNELNNHASLAERLSKFDRQLNPQASIKDELIYQHINQQSKQKLDLTQFEDQDSE